ncbi:MULTISPECIES: TlpA family protein disulfide reductase [Flavobacterium]|uniref:TlpA family protein disulfide reductase n=1 Tax=Flavobacterium ranwuense TaxID=2541725 RepID=A0ABY2DQ17_9FLAO|nr:MULTISPECIES: TlpA disulfide reductase family protein [Flavobacterium]TDE27994.1 TlpA family protein disulfide reductase [Flavobacterium ranwuense]TDE53887.1 TlpA family protein disulfide reductase [Flavobacterium sp. GT3P67]
MKKRIILVCLFISLSNTYGQDYQKSNVVLEGQQAPNFTIKLEKGKTINLSSLKGKVVLLNFFATWCGPCMVEMPILQQEVWAKYKENKNFVLMSFGRGHSAEEVNLFRDKKKFDFPIYADKDKSVYNLFATQYIPRNYLIDKNGIIVYSSIGYSPEEFEKMKEKINEIIK